MKTRIQPHANAIFESVLTNMVIKFIPDGIYKAMFNKDTLGQ